MSDIPAKLKINGRYTDGIITDDFTGITKGNRMKHKISYHREHGFVTIKQYLKQMKIDLDSKEILEKFNIQGCYLYLDPDKIPKKQKKKKKVPNGGVDPYTLDKQLMTDCGPNCFKLCIKCENDCKLTVHEGTWPCKNYKQVKGVYSDLRAAKEYPRKYDRQMHVFCLEFYKDTDDPYWGKNGSRR